ncbi:MAG: lysophospholipid acyltransferase family protein [Clostridia bacterium]|nr:lysophospholipid acyltransferase family protein [Clostridia bacterium]
MFFRTIITYVNLVARVVGGYHYVGKSDKIRAEQGEAAGDMYAAARGAEILTKVFSYTGSEVIVEGAENIPQEGNFVLIANHQSMIDIFAIMVSLGRPVAFIAKEELKKVPILNNWMRAVGCVFMNRSDLKESLKALIEGIRKVKAGDSMCIFPEGTRTDGPMLEFKGGSFKLATKSGAPILPLTIDGSHRMLEDNHFWITKETIKLTYHPVIQTKGMSKEEQNELPSRVQDIIGSALKEEERYGKNKDTGR